MLPSAVTDTALGSAGWDQPRSNTCNDTAFFPSATRCCPTSRKPNLAWKRAEPGLGGSRSYSQQSSGTPVSAGTAVLLVDTLGELVACYLAADAAFVGGSLVPVGGHSLVEPAAAGLPLFSGRRVENAPEIAAALAAAEGLAWVEDAAGLASNLIRLALDPAMARARGAAARAVVEESRGACARILAAISGRPAPPA